MLTVILVSLLVGYAVLELSLAVGAARGRVDRSLVLARSYGFGEDAPVVDEPVERASPVGLIGSRFISRLGGAGLEEQRRLLLAAGYYDITPERFLGFRILGAVGVPILLLQFAISSMAPVLAVLLLVLAGLVGWTLPSTIMARRGTQRLQVIDRSMPELVDLLVVCVEAGMAFNAALRAATERVDGPLGVELRLLLQEQQLGASMADALGHVVERADTPAVRAFVRTIAQADKLGVPVGSLMRTLAEEMRKRRRASAEEQAQKAPVKILFPLVFLIFPSILVVLMAPAGLALMESFK